MRRFLSRSVIASLALAGGLALLASCESTDETATQPAAMGAINDRCPMSGRPVNPASTTTYNGMTVGFCCDDCKGTWTAKTTTEKTASVNSMMNR